MRHAIVLWYRSRDLSGSADGWAVLPLATASQRYLRPFFGHGGRRYSVITCRDIRLEGRGRVAVVVVEAIARLANRNTASGEASVIGRVRIAEQQTTRLTEVVDSFKSDMETDK